MTADFVITCKATLRETPPDILLTNYKMLDYLLIRPRDQPLWRFNSPGLWRYLVVDELHTFDGAQGTDLACLIRRLRDRLQAGPELACVGTSATIGGEASAQALTDYASQVFSLPFDAASVIREDRLSADEFLAGSAVTDSGWPDARTVASMGLDNYRSINDFVDAHASVWFDRAPDGLASPDAAQRARAAIDLGDKLKRHSAFQELLRGCQPIHWDGSRISPPRSTGHYAWDLDCSSKSGPLPALGSRSSITP